MGDRDAGVCGGGHRRRDPRHYLKGDLRLGQRQGFFAAPAENERVAALEPYHRLPRHPLRDQQLVDFRLGQRLPASFLAHEHTLRRRGRQLHQGRIKQPVVHHHLRGSQRLCALDGQ